MRFDGNVYYHELEAYPAEKLFDEWRETAITLDQGGFTTCWLGEHHFWHKGYPVACPNPILVGMHLASVTKTLRMGQSANILPDYHPIRLAEDIATADHLVKGRLDIGIARGTNSTASIQFKREADRRDPQVNYRLFEEVFEIMKKCWTQDAMSHEGEFFTFPVPGWSELDGRFVKESPEHYHDDGSLKALGVMPKPYQKPYPPIWQAADSTMSYEFAARRGHSIIGINRSFEGTREAWTKFKETSEELCGHAVPMGQAADDQTLNAMRLFHMAETQEEAEREARPGINAFYDAATGLNPNWARKGLLAADEELAPGDEDLDWFDFLKKYEVSLVGSPEFVAERIHKYREELNCQHVTLWPNPGFVPFKKVLRGIELFAEKVIPQFEQSEVQAAQ
ncbi:MAG: LLM class flavin-dependent oxidoreductase [Rhodospirillaceae bacterium]|nr:LLM class flavin-dependent oxidoreductase [Rhodospirillaceae bacterium]